jgi:hypothetical protein
VIQQMMYATENMDPPSEYTRFLLKAKHWDSSVFS